MKYIVAFFLLIISQSALGQSPSVQKQLEDELNGKVLLLRGFPEDGRIGYDAKGEPATHIRTGPWTTSKILVNRITVKDNQVAIYGERVVLYYAEDKIHHMDAGSRIELKIASPFAALPADERPGPDLHSE